MGIESKLKIAPPWLEGKRLMLEAINGSMMFAASAYLLWIAVLAVRRSRRDTHMRDAFFAPPTRREVEAARRWLRRELEVGA